MDIGVNLGEMQGDFRSDSTVINPNMTPVCSEMSADCSEMNSDCSEMRSDCSEIGAILDFGFWIFDWTARPIADRTECGKWQVTGDGVTGVATPGSGFWILGRMWLWAFLHYYTTRGGT